jgi:hypothetical protein
MSGLPHATAADTPDALQREVDAARQQINSLTLTLHDVQARLERKHLALLQSRSKGTPLAHQVHDAWPASQARLHLLAANELQPHCHLDFAVEGLTPSRPSAASLRFRVVRHFDHPGVAILSTDPSHLPLTAWRASGSEDGVAFMMFMPSDPVGRTRIQSLRTSDWRLLDHLTAIAHQQLQLSDWHIARWWVDVAARLRGELAAIPDVLRFESAIVEGMGDGGGQVDVRMTRVEFGRRELGDIHLRWSSGGGLRWLKPGAAGFVPPSVWPVDAAGNLTSEFALPFGGGSIEARLRFWRHLASPERALMRALIDTFAQTSLTGTVGQATGNSGHATSTLGSLARDMQRQLRWLGAYDGIRRLFGAQRG